MAPTLLTVAAHGDVKWLRRPLGPMWLVLALAAAIRVYGLASYAGAIDGEGAEYARIAENLLSGNGYRGIATPGKQLFFPPLFPWLIAAVSLLTGQVESAGRLVSVRLGSTLVVPVYFIGNSLFGRRPALIAAMLTAIHPSFVLCSISVQSEPTYLTLALTGAYFAVKAFGAPSVGTFMLMGVFWGLAYLVRPEAITYPFLVGAITVALRLAHKHRPRRLLLSWLLMCMTFTLLSAPYIAWLSAETGQWRFEGKTPLNSATRLRMMGGASLEEAAYAVEENLTEHGVWIQPNLSIIQSARLSAFQLASYVIAQIGEVGNYVLRTVGSYTAFGSPPLFAIAAIGLFSRPWDRRIASAQSLLCAMLAVSATGLFFIYYRGDRFLLMFVVVFIIWAGPGITALSQWTAESAKLISNAARAPKWVEPASIGVVAAIVLFVTIPALTWGVRDNMSSRELKKAGEWLRTHARGSARVMDVTTVLAFHATATFVPFPYSSSETAVKYIDKHNVNFVVLGDHFDPTVRPYLREWLDKGIPSSRVRKVYEAAPTAARRLTIYSLE